MIIMSKLKAQFLVKRPMLKLKLKNKLELKIPNVRNSVTNEKRD